MRAGCRRVLPLDVVRSGTVLAATVLISFQMASAQQLRGRLIDVESADPVPAGVLTLLQPDRISVSAAVSDENGHWLLQVPKPGIYYVHATRVGYQTWVAGPLRLDQGDDFNSVFRLRRLAVVLDPIEVTATAETERLLELTGFYERQRSDFGHFMTPQDIDKRRAPRVTDLLMGLPGVHLVSMAEGGVGARYVQLRGSNLSQGGVCRPRVYVDGLMFARGDSRPVRLMDDDATEMVEDQLWRIDQGLSLDDIGHPSSIAAVEIYRSSSQVPVRFGGTSTETQCGVIVIWTRSGRMLSAGR